jgi:uncharacterized protein
LDKDRRINMPEYLAPGVYVEEVDTGSKPIEGVSTSTAGMVGVTERGPVNVPILITGFGEYQRWFGQTLNEDLYGEYRFLPHAVEGFFQNGGKRVYDTRVLKIDQALSASRDLVAPDTAVPPQAQLIVPAAPNATEVIIESNPGFVIDDTLQISDGVGADFEIVATAPSNANVVALVRPLSFDHANPNQVRRVTLADNTTAGEVHSSTLSVDVAAGETRIRLTSAAFNPPLAEGDLLRIGTLTGGTHPDDEEMMFVDRLLGGNTVQLHAPLQWSHARTTEVHRQQAAAFVGAPTTVPLNYPAAPGAAVIVVSTAGFTAVGEWARFDHNDSKRVEFRRMGRLARIALAQPAYADYPAGTRIARAGTVAGLAAQGTCDLIADAEVGATVISVSDRTLIDEGDLLGIGLAGQREYVEVASLPPSGQPPSGNVVLRAPLQRQHLAPQTPLAGTVDIFPPLGASALYTTVAMNASPGAPALTITDPRSPTTFAANNILIVLPPSGGPYFHVLPANPVTNLTPQVVPLAQPLSNAHATGAVVAGRQPMILVQAIDAGQWGNRLRVGMEIQDPPLLVTRIRQTLPGGRLRLESAAGIEIGSELLVTGSNGITTQVKVANIDRGNDFEITLEGSTTLPGPVGPGAPVRSREYRFVVELLRQPDPSNPARNNIAIDREVFAGLSLDPRHTNYFQRVIGCTWNMSSSTTSVDDMGSPLRRTDRRSEGGSNYVRVRDLSPSNGLRQAPVATYETPPGGIPRLLLLPLGNGDDMLSSIDDKTYIGNDNLNPELRTGLFTLRNIEDISIVAAPGRTKAEMQGALINHCELMRYRFAVLDGPPPPADGIADVQFQRQQFDTKYAALYHPWLLISDPYPTNLAQIAEYPIPPSGHMLGIYARTDIERGVHKAPANEVVRGVIGLRRILNKEQHDILNPSPTNINVIRDFRPNNRGIRVYGGRCITSDSDWKYVNVRRLLIFIEASLDRGLQWVVFEPNAEPLWARVRTSVSSFLTTVWRNGALEGTTREQAYFVKCDRTTMTQADIDNGKLICVIGVAPVKPAEFVIIRIGLWTAQAEE